MLLTIVLFALMLMLLLGLIVNVAFAFAVIRDADECQKKSSLLLVGPAIWFLATLVAGPFTAAIYWILNHSTLNPRVERESASSRQPHSVVEDLYEEGALGYGNELDDAAVETFLKS